MNNKNSELLRSLFPGQGGIEDGVSSNKLPSPIKSWEFVDNGNHNADKPPMIKDQHTGKIWPLLEQDALGAEAALILTKQPIKSLTEMHPQVRDFLVNLANLRNAVSQQEITAEQPTPL